MSNAFVTSKRSSIMECLEGETTTTDTPVADPTRFDRAALLANSITILKNMERRLIGDRFKSRESDKDYLAFARAYAALLATVNTVARDTEIADMQREIDELKETQGYR